MTSAKQPLRFLTAAAVASLAAGAIHGTAAGRHSDHRQAVAAFVAVAVFQIGWGGLALVRDNVPVALLGVVGNAAALVGWALAKTSGISFVEGLEEAEDVQFADAVAAGCAAVAILAALVAIVAIGRPQLGVLGRRTLGATAVMAALGAAVPGMVAAGSHDHGSGGHDESSNAHDHTATDETDGDSDSETAEAAHGHDSQGRPFDPTQPIDLGGFEGVTPEQQAQAENLLALNLARLPQWADTATAEAAGFRSIGDDFNREEHFINWSYIDDDKVLDPDHPESLVYRVEGEDRILEAAMYMLPRGTTLETVPDVGGTLMQWHIHNDLCFTDDPEAPQFAGIKDESGNCPAGLEPLPEVPMIHVWIRTHPCGPFAALDGISGGQIRDGEERLCDHTHGSGSGSGSGSGTL